MDIATRHDKRLISGDELRAVRRGADVSQAALAAAMGVSRGRVVILEGAARVPLHASVRYVDALDALVRDREARGQ